MSFAADCRDAVCEGGILLIQSIALTGVESPYQ